MALPATIRLGATAARRRGPAVVPTGVTLAEPLNRRQRCFKRTLDLLLASVLLALTLPILLLAALAITLDSPGPVFFNQTRVGARGRLFRILKLRTMRTDTEDTSHREYVAALMRGEADRRAGLFKAVDDPRITRVGRFLRRTSIDELPQLFNVIRGEMSLVGPRPPTLFEAEQYGAETWPRLCGRPGLTGLWQVEGRALLDFHQMVDLDLTYWESWTPLLELRILMHTAPAVLSGRGAG